MRTLVVHCHPDPESFTAAVRDRAIEALRERGHEVRLTDLYAMRFDPVLSKREERAATSSRAPTRRSPITPPTSCGASGSSSSTRRGGAVSPPC